VDFKDLALVLKKASVSAAGEPVAAVTVRYGLFVNSVIDFLIVAFTIFLVVRAMNRVIRKREEAEAQAES
jgi:large conductance mechanosensitive channel